MVRKQFCYINRKIIPEKESSINLNDIGLLRGYGVFDFLRTYNGIPFLLDEHLDRLENSAKQLGIKSPLSKKKLKEIVTDLVSRNNHDESTIRIVLTGGVSPDGMSIGDEPTLFVITRDLKPVPKEVYTKGVKLITDEYLRHIPGAKHLDYSNLVKQMKVLVKNHAFSLLYIDNDRVLEAAICNFFIVKNKSLITPRDDVLLGTTRNLIINLSQNKYIIEERKISIKELWTADEAFVTGTTQGIVPVVNIDEHIIGAGKPGLITGNLIGIFNEYVDKVSV